MQHITVASKVPVSLHVNGEENVPPSQLSCSVVIMYMRE